MGFLCCSLLEAMDPLSEELADILPCTVAKEVGKEREEGGLDMGDMIELQTMVCEDFTILEKSPTRHPNFMFTYHVACS